MQIKSFDIHFSFIDCREYPVISSKNIKSFCIIDDYFVFQSHSENKTEYNQQSIQIVISKLSFIIWAITVNIYPIIGIIIIVAIVAIKARRTANIVDIIRWVILVFINNFYIRVIIVIHSSICTLIKSYNSIWSNCIFSDIFISPIITM